MKRESIEKLLAITFCVINENFNNDDIFRQVGKLNCFCTDNLHKFYANFREFGNPYDDEYILEYLVFSYKLYSSTTEITIERKCPESLIFHMYSHEIYEFIEAMQIYAPYLYDLVYFNWNDSKFNREYNIKEYNS